MKNIVIMPVGQRVMSVLVAFSCLFISAVALFSVWNAVDCFKHGMIGSDPECPAQFGWQLFAMNPFVLLSLFFLAALGFEAVRTPDSVARRTLLWWAILFVGLIMVMKVF